MRAALALAAWAAVQAPGGWVPRPGTASVGDTIWLERRIATPPGWGVRPVRLAPGGTVEPLGDPVVRRDSAGWVVRYPVVAWTAGRQRLELPLLWQLGPFGEADSMPGGVAVFDVVSVLPDTGDPVPQPPRPPLRHRLRRPWWPVGAAVLAAAALGAGLRWRRRAPRLDRGVVSVVRDEEPPDAVWLAAGEARAVAARASALLRTALADVVPDAHGGLTTDECLVVLARARPGAELDDIAAVLRGLDRAAFGPTDASDVAALAERARTLAARAAR